MAAARASTNKRFVGLKLLLLFCLGCVFLWLAYGQLMLFWETRRIRGDLSGLFRACFFIAFFLALTFGAWIGPIAYVVRIVRRQPRDDRPD